MTYKKRYFTAFSLFLLGGFLVALPIGLSQTAISGWHNLYEKYTIKEPVYKETCLPSAYNSTLDRYNEQICYETIDKYQEKIITTEKIIGITDGEDVIKDSYTDGKRTYIMYVAPGDRNWEEFGCRDYEKEKGVCIEI